MQKRSMNGNNSGEIAGNGKQDTAPWFRVGLGLPLAWGEVER